MARDLFHAAVRNALEKEGWSITHDPYKMKIEDVLYEIDLGAERLLAAEMDGEKIAIEVKNFAGPSTVSEFHKAVGQFVDYGTALEIFEPDRVLFLAIPESIYLTFFQKVVIQKTMERIRAKLLVYNPKSETIVTWIR